MEQNTTNNKEKTQKIILTVLIVVFCLLVISIIVVVSFVNRKIIQQKDLNTQETVEVSNDEEEVKSDILYEVPKKTEEIIDETKDITEDTEEVDDGDSLEIQEALAVDYFYSKMLKGDSHMVYFDLNKNIPINVYLLNGYDNENYMIDNADIPALTNKDFIDSEIDSDCYCYYFEKNGFYYSFINYGNHVDVLVGEELSEDNEELASFDISMPTDFSVYVNADDGYVNMRKGPGTEYDIITPIEFGTILPVLKDEGRWYYICYMGEYGYIAASQVMMEDDY